MVRSSGAGGDSTDDKTWENRIQRGGFSTPNQSDTPLFLPFTQAMINSISLTLMVFFKQTWMDSVLRVCANMNAIVEC